ncbi:pilus subunit protein [Burkholderia pseudomallei]|uniref:Pilus subunit protein n=7 Tax=Burkholderia pseudomallei TaxID=28450 RepID=Q63I84_BURPS|nr:putative pilus subunit protein [Burkholderia pseudomallei 1710b]AFI70563.1 pilus subunit protein [Burkholderia pseudomallei 1026b]AGR67750.1 flp/Fap pilin component family protein [Burkholderia pseudomallei MSHR305]AGZ31949.1 flp/Fap pilin component family protein [Burkholderia pseudomallei NCTC 13179]AHE30345.1 flp/Fap pilin component family protein [Burkholderia pseudomallei NCTC 13178]AHE37304.1 flp/Fap pilin component family protein [Burkholderia pseudomallei NAU20B-16]AHG37962.1 flp/F
MRTQSFSRKSPRAHGIGARPARAFMRWLRDESAVSAIEYALIASLIAIVIIGAVQVVGTNLQSVFSTVASDV